jgi:hypothetical protein
MQQRDLLLDVTRLVWRVWSGRLPTGIDRVCLAYLDHYAPRSLAVIQRKELRLVLSVRHSDQLFALLRAGGPGFRRRRCRAGRVARPGVGPISTSATPGWIRLAWPAGWPNSTGSRSIWSMT